MCNTPEDVFVKELKLFFNDELVINDFSEQRIRRLLFQYKKSLKLAPVIIHKEVPVESIVYIERKLKNKTTTATFNDLMVVANEICIKHSIPMSTLRRQLDKSRIVRNVEARMDFARAVKSRFYATLPQLAKFLNIDHSTVIYYLQGKKRIAPKTKVEQILA